MRNGSSRGDLYRPVQRPLGYTPRSGAGLLGYERVLARAGLAPVAGIDEAGRGACAGPLVVAAAVLPVDGAGSRFRTGQLADSKMLTPAAREKVYHDILRRALAWHVVVIPAGDLDRLGLHVCNVTGMRRALAGLGCRPGYVLTDGFPVSGMPVPGLAVWKGDQVAACVAAASVLAKVTRDRIMIDLHERYPQYEFAEHKGYVTERHAKALAEHGPCPEHRFRYANVNEALRALERSADADLTLMDDAVADDAMKDEYVADDSGSAYPVPGNAVPVDRALGGPVRPAVASGGTRAGGPAARDAAPGSAARGSGALGDAALGEPALDEQALDELAPDDAALDGGAPSGGALEDADYPGDAAPGDPPPDGEAPEHADRGNAADDGAPGAPATGRPESYGHRGHGRGGAGTMIGPVAGSEGRT